MEEEVAVVPSSFSLLIEDLSPEEIERAKTYKIKCAKIRKKCIAHSKSMSIIFHSFGKLKSKGARARHNSIDPFVFDKKRGKQVEYPLPFRRSSSTGASSRDVGQIMSHVNTSSTEQRKDILASLSKMVFLSSNPRDGKFCSVDRGSVEPVNI